MITPARVLRSGLAWALSLAALGCADELRDAPELVVSVATDLGGGELAYLLVETLDVAGEAPVDTRWLSVGDACPTRDDGLRALGSFSVQRGDQALARLRITALRALVDGSAIEVGRQRVDALFARGRVPIDLTLSRVCSQVSCAADTTCDPISGACRDVQRIELPASASGAESARAGCIAPLTEAPPVVTMRNDNVTPPPTCVTGDGRCDTDCDGSRDADCLRARGQPCLSSNECVAGAFCVHGFCCDQPCAGACERCDLAGQAGRCAPLAYASTSAPLSSPDFAAECSEDRLRYACAGGACAASCLAGFGDCDAALQDNGCETPLGTANHCKSCGDACVYGYCGVGGCEWHHSTELETSSSRTLNPDRLYASDFFPSSSDTVVRALGALVHPELAGTKLRLALYAGNDAGSPDKLLAQTENLSIVDAKHSLIPAQPRAIRVEGAVAATELAPGRDYFVAVQVAQATQLHGNEQSAAIWYVVPHEYGLFPTYFPVTEDVSEFIALTLYAITTPH